MTRRTLAVLILVLTNAAVVTIERPQRGVAEALTGCPAVVSIVAIGAASSGAPELRSITAPPLDTMSIYLHIIAHATEAREPRTSGGRHLLGGGRIEAPGHS